MEEALNEATVAGVRETAHAACYERDEAKQCPCSGYYTRNLTTASSDATLHVHCLNGDGYREVLGAAEDMNEHRPVG